MKNGNRYPSVLSSTLFLYLTMAKNSRFLHAISSVILLENFILSALDIHIYMYIFFFENIFIKGRESSKGFENNIRSDRGAEGIGVRSR